MSASMGTDLVEIERTLLDSVLGGNLAPIIGPTRLQQQAQAQSRDMNTRMLFTALGSKLADTQRALRAANEPDPNQLAQMMLTMMQR
jgi:hypothetical protein